jgi:branched-chain amino acid aminotransferase
MLTYLNTEFVAADRAMLHVTDLAIQRGYGIFEFLKVRKGVPLFLNDYLDRFYRSAEAMQLNVPYSREALQQIIHELLSRNQAVDCGIKMILTGGYSPDAFSIATPNLVIQQYPLALSDAMAAGVKVITHEYVREMPAVKTINYLTGIRQLQRMHEAKASDVLYHQRGVVSEFPRCNFFIVNAAGELCTPSENILHGITRMNVLALARRQGTVKEGIVTLDDVWQAREAFLTSTTKRIIPITQIDEHRVGDGNPGAVTRALHRALVALEDEQLK